MSALSIATLQMLQSISHSSMETSVLFPLQRVCPYFQFQEHTFQSYDKCRLSSGLNGKANVLQCKMF